MLRKIRIVVAALFFALITLLFLDFTGALHTWFGWMAKVQLLPAVLALNVGVIVFLVVLTLLFGRVYCSVICPMGVFQDIVSWLNGRRKGKKNRFGYKKEIKWLRYGMLVLFIVLMIAGLNAIALLIALLTIACTLTTAAADTVAVIVTYERDGAENLYTAIDADGDSWEFWADAEEYFMGDIVYLTVWEDEMEIVGVDTVGHLTPVEMMNLFSK